MSNLVDFVPLLQYFPNRMRMRGQKLHNGLLETYGGLIKEIELERNSGKVVDDCLVKSMLQSRKEEDLDCLDMAILASAFMIGGVETVRLPQILAQYTSDKSDLLRRRLSCSGSPP